MAFSLIIQQLLSFLFPQYLLEHSCFTVLFQFLLCSKVNQLCMIHICESFMCTYMLFFFKFLSYLHHHGPLNRVSLCCVVGPYQLSILCIACCLVARSCPILLRSHGLSMGLSREECWSVLPFPSPGDLPDPGITLTAPATSPALSVGSLPLSHQGNPFYTQQHIYVNPNLPVYSLPTSRLIINLFYIRDSYFCFINKFICAIFLLVYFLQPGCSLFCTLKNVHVTTAGAF